MTIRASCASATSCPPNGSGLRARVDKPDCTGSHKRIVEKMRDRRAAELRRWGAPEGGMAEACAEVASAPVHVVPVLSLVAYRRFRADFLEPLLAESLNLLDKINSCFPSVSRIPVRIIISTY